MEVMIHIIIWNYKNINIYSLYQIAETWNILQLIFVVTFKYMKMSYFPR